MHTSSLALIIVGAMLTQEHLTGPDVSENEGAEGFYSTGTFLLGSLLTLLTCCLSGFAGVYSEKLLKASNPIRDMPSLTRQPSGRGVKATATASIGPT